MAKEMSDRQRANLWAKLEQLRIQIAHAETELAKAREQRRHDDIGPIAARLRTLKGQRAEINRQLGPTRQPKARGRGRGNTGRDW
jgi:hypothetical protein